MNIGKQAVTAEECNTTYCFCIECSPFYWKDLDAKSATVVLSQLPAGSFLVRPSRHPAFKYTLSQKEPGKQILHIRIGKDETGKYLMDADKNLSFLPLIRFSCVTNMVNCWCRVYRDIAKRWPLTPVPNPCVRSKAVYINEEVGGVCFHDDENAEKSFYNYCSQLVQESS